MGEFEDRMARVTGPERSAAADAARRATRLAEERTLSAARAAKFIKRMTQGKVPAIPLYIREVEQKGWHSPTDTNRLPKTTAYPKLGEGWVVREYVGSGDEKASGLFLSTLNIVRECGYVEYEPPRDTHLQDFAGGEFVMASGQRVQGKPPEQILPHTEFASEAGYDLLAVAAVRLIAQG
jgi:hypothetical protein